MLEKADPPLTQLLNSAADGDRTAWDQLWYLVQDQMRRMARDLLGSGASSRTLRPTALISEVYLRLSGKPHHFESGQHFFNTAARVMRQIRADYARESMALKRGGRVTREPLEDNHHFSELDPAEVLGVHEVIDRLAERHPEQAEVVMLRYFSR